MPNFHCPGCLALLTREEAHGIRCPECGGALRQPSRNHRERLTPSWENDEEELADSLSPPASLNWKRVRIALTLLAAAALVFLPSQLLFYGGPVLLSNVGPGLDDPLCHRIHNLALGLVALGNLAGIILTLLGLGWCCGAPAVLRARGLAIGAILCPAAALPLLLAGMMLALLMRPLLPSERLMPVLMGIAWLLPLVVFLLGPGLHLFFLRRVARVVQAPVLAAHFLMLLVCLCVAAVLSVAGFGVFMLPVPLIQEVSGRTRNLLVFGGTVTLSLILTTWYAILTLRLRSHLGRWPGLTRTEE